MEQVESQVKLPLKRSFQIAVQGIRIRIGRSLVTLSGVMLGMAFLMNAVTTQLVQKALSHERAVRQKVNLMLAMVRAETGEVTGKTLAVVVFGAMDRVERRFLAALLGLRPAEIRALGWSQPGVREASAENVGEGAAVLLVMGDAASADHPVSRLAAGMTQAVLLDTRADRRFPGGLPQGVRRDLFWGSPMAEQEERMERERRQAAARTLWIVGASLAVTVIGVANAFLMSVTERFREIGTMKCLGALSAFIRSLFLIESALLGLTGSVLGVAVGAALSLGIYGMVYGFGAVFGSLAWGRWAVCAVGGVALGTLLAMLAAVYPARYAARMVPASALRSTV